MPYIIYPVLSLVLSALFSIVIIKLANKYKLFHKIRSRDVHNRPTARLGGVAIVLSFLIAMVALAIFGSKELTDFGFPYAAFGISIDKRLLGIILAVVVLSAVMLIDDLKDVDPKLKLGAQILSAVILVLAGVGITFVNNPFGLQINLDQIKIPIEVASQVYHIVLFADLFLIVWIVLLANATNFIDGLDGLATTLVSLATISLIFQSIQVGQTATALMGTVLLGSILGFLPFNLPRAKLFLGDVGSMFFGLILGVLTVISGGKLVTLLLVFGIVIIDAVYVVIKRIIRGRHPITAADQSHIHHRFLKAGFSPVATLLLISLISISFGSIGIFTFGKTKIMGVVIMTLFCLGLFAWLDLTARRKNVD